MPAAERANTLEFLGFRLDRLRRVLASPDGRHVDLTPRVFDLLVVLAERPGEVVTKSDLMDAVWPGITVEENSLNQAVSTLRKALADHGGDRGMIVTVSGRGYQFAASVAAVPEPDDHPVAAASAAERGPDIAGRRRSPIAGLMSGLGGRVAAVLAVTAAVIAAVFVYISATGSGSAPSASVAVLPFVDRNGDQSHLAAGMTDEVISRLRRIEGLAVAGGEWMPALVERLGDPKAIGASLSVTHLLEGGVRRDGDRLRISARLTATGDGHLVWSKDYELQTAEVFAIQDQIAHAVANALSVALGVGIQSASHGGTSDFEAYDHYLQGRALRNMPPPENAIGELEKAVAIDPMYARAWSELTLALGGRARLAKTMTEMAPTLARMDEASRNAERIAPGVWFSHMARAWYHMVRNDWVAADAANRAAEATGDASDPEYLITQGAFSQQVGRLRARLRFDERLAQIDPHHPDVLGANFITLTALGDYEAAWKAYRAGGAVRSGSNPNPEFHMMLLALADGRLEEARPWFRANLKAPGPDGRTMADVLDEPEAALGFIRPMLDAPAGTQDRWAFVYGALMAGQFGDTGLALELLRRAYLGPGWAGQYGIWYPQLRETRRTEGFKQFVRDLGFVRMWRASGDWGDFCHPVGEDDFECS